MTKSTAVAAAATALLFAVASTVSAQTYRMTTSIAPGVATPDKIETSIGTLHLRDGVPKPVHVRCQPWAMFSIT